MKSMNDWDAMMIIVVGLLWEMMIQYWSIWWIGKNAKIGIDPLSYYNAKG